MDKVGSILVHSGPYVRGAGGRAGGGTEGGSDRRALPAATPAPSSGFPVANTAELLAHLAPVSAQCQGVPAGEQGVFTVGEQGVTVSPGQAENPHSAAGRVEGSGHSSKRYPHVGFLPFGDGDR